jgi:hypothetical protein
MSRDHPDTCIFENYGAGSGTPMGRFLDRLEISRAHDATRKAEVADPVARTSLPVDERVIRDRREAVLKAELADTRRLYNAANKRTNALEEIKEIAKSTILAIPPAKVATPQIGKRDGSETVEDGLLAWADWHGGERISLDVMDGLNVYDPRVMSRRAQETVDTTLGLLFGNHRGTTFEHLFVADLGDSVAGDLLHDNKATNALGVFQSIAAVAAVKARALTELASRIPVTYVGVPGNHGRRTEKMPWKQPSETADWLVYYLVSLMCAGNERIEVVVPESWYAGLVIRGHGFALNHGTSAAKGGFGGISWYSFMRHDAKMTAIDSARGRRIRYRLFGHVHTSATIPRKGGNGEIFIVGSLKGGDEYALGELGEFDVPKQLLVGIHDRRGVSWRYPLEVTDSDDIESRYEECLEPFATLR